MTEPTENRWHLDKRVQISHLVATATAVVAVMAYIANLRTDVEVLKAEMTQQRIRDDRQDAAVNSAIELQRQTLSRIEDKLDRAIERTTANGGKR